MNKTRFFSIFLCLLAFTQGSLADQARILFADFQQAGDGLWRVSVTLKHADAGWDHYADNWRVVDGQGNVLADRVLYHPHVNEQPFTRSQGGVDIPKGVELVYIEAHDKVHGWSKQRLKVDMSRVEGGRLQVPAKE